MVAEQLIAEPADDEASAQQWRIRYTTVPNRLYDYEDLGPSDKLIYCVLQSFCDQPGRCMVKLSLTLLQKRSGLTRPTVVSALSNLERIGLIGRSIGKGGAKNCYSLHINEAGSTVNVSSQDGVE